MIFYFSAPPSPSRGIFLPSNDPWMKDLRSHPELRPRLLADVRRSHHTASIKNNALSTNVFQQGNCCFLSERLISGSTQEHAVKDIVEISQLSGERNMRSLPLPKFLVKMMHSLIQQIETFEAVPQEAESYISLHSRNLLSIHGAHNCRGDLHKFPNFQRAIQLADRQTHG